jgi:hypothetical protein
MTTTGLKELLATHLGGVSQKQIASNQEVLNHVLKNKSEQTIQFMDVLACEVDGTLVFLSDAGLPKARNVIFLDLISQTSFFRTLECCAD